MKSTLCDKIENNIYCGLVTNQLSNDDLCAIIELSLTLLNATPVQDYANQEFKTYNGVKKHDKNYRKIKHLKFVINNK